LLFLNYIQSFYFI